MDKIKILIAEDVKLAQTIYDSGLYGNIFEKSFVSNGADALKTYLSWQPDIVLLDIKMPVLSGYAVLKKIRTKHEDKKTAIIMATSLAAKDDIVSCINLGIQGYILKPIKAGDIAGQVLEYYQKTNPERAQKAIEELDKAKQTRKAPMGEEKAEETKKETGITEEKKVRETKEETK